MKKDNLLALRVASRFRGLDPLAYTVARRFVADEIGNPQALLKLYDLAVQHLAADLEPILPKMREAQKFIEAHAGEGIQRKALRNELAPHENELVNLYSKNIYRVGSRIGLEVMKHANPWSLFLAILQQYELVPASRKAIETASKYFAKTRIQRPKNLDVWIDAYENFLKTLRAFSLAAHDAIAHGKPRAAGGAGGAGGAEAQELVPEKVKAGPFTIINTGGFNDTVIAECARVIEVAAHQLQSHGLGRVCYGDVLISNTLSKANVLAFYLLQKDEMFVRANLKGKEGAAVETLTHELGHRLMYKFLTSKHKEIRNIYNTIARKRSEAKSEAISLIWKDPNLKPKPGDIFVSGKGEEFVVTGFDVSPRKGIIVQLVAKVQPEPGVTVKATIPLESYALAKGIFPKIKHSGFVTGYAAKNADENFAEMVAHYCADKLPEDQVEMLKNLL